MIGKIIWEAFSVALLLYGLYLTYVFMWFSMFRILDMDMEKAKLIAGTIALIILIVSSVRWFMKKQKELKNMKEEG
ncbi:hypothetical protein [Sulfurihydrogenibium subterraneum]|uniref:hypothetical protein n=1 Tax=Sulfurihydrogenibium subterraneum TaxID=171121 RepID=UPI00048C8B27|nr:hypothetical protein [Sulfurihydrogenibium subterraneum]